jgi:glycosyltransferase involved in cell wall biosynthesis
MRIGMMSAWNTDSGVALHAEPVGKAWREMGHELAVFSFIKEDFHGEGFTGEDEDYVIRCFGTRRTDFLDPRPILTKSFDIFVVQDLNMLPVENLAKIFPLIQKRAKTVHIVHENALPEEAGFYQFGWDGVVYFCRRQSFLKEVYPQAKLIHFPCFAVRRKEKLEARKRLELPLDKKIVYEFCQRGYRPFLRELPEELKGKAALLIVIPPDYELLEEESPPPWMIIRREKTLSHDRFDDYLFASDAVILHKFQSRYRAVVSSTAFQALGTGCPILVPGQSDFFFPLKDEVIRYEDTEDLKETLVDLLEDGERYRALEVKAGEFAKGNSPRKIAEEHIKLFRSLRRNVGRA